MVKTESGATNIFNISSSEQYRCQVYRYHAKLSRLYISVLKLPADTPVFYLVFSDVAYMDCPVNWQGADFTIGTTDECIQLMLDAGLIGQAILRFPGAYAGITEYARLYTSQMASGYRIRIIANSANMIQSLPDSLL